MGKKKVTRVRTGCWTCRRRGYKCDEGKPTCDNCLKRNLSCEGYAIRLKWSEDKLVKKFAESISMEKALGEGPSKTYTGYDSSSSPERDSSSSDRSPSISVPGESTFQLKIDSPVGDSQLAKVKTEPTKYEHIDTTSPDNSMVNRGYALSSSAPGTVASYLPCPSSSSSSFSYRDGTPHASSSRPHHHVSVSPLQNMELQHELTVHYLTRVSEDLCPVDIFSVNIYRDVVVPFSAVSTQYAICGLSSLYLTDVDSSYALLSTEFKVEAIKALRISLEALTEGKSTPDLSGAPQGSAFTDKVPSFPQDVLSTAILLASQEALSGNYDEWRSHVKGGAKLLWTVFGSRLYQAELTPEAQSLVDILCYHDTVSTIMGDKPLVASEFPSTMSNNPHSTFSRLVGPIYRLVSRITLLAYTIHEMDQKATGLIIGPFSISENLPNQLANDRLQLYSQLETKSYKDNDGDQLSAGSSATVIDSNAPHTSYSKDIYHNLSSILHNCALLYFWLRLDHQQLGRELSQIVKVTTADSLRLLDHIDPNSGMNALLAWPLWQLGVCADSEEIQQIIMARLITIQEYSHRGGIKTIIKYLITFWDLMRQPAYAPYTRRELLNLTKQRCSPVVLF